MSVVPSCFVLVVSCRHGRFQLRTGDRVWVKRANRQIRAASASVWVLFRRNSFYVSGRLGRFQLFTGDRV